MRQKLQSHSIISISLLLISLSSVSQSISSKKIGDQEWMVVNLNVSNFRNGDPIPEAKTTEQWINACKNGKPAWCYFNNDPANASKFGKLYNWYAINDARGLAPKGWHIPNKEEWQYLIDTIIRVDDDKEQVSKMMKSTTGWKNYQYLERGYKTCSQCNGFGEVVGNSGRWYPCATCWKTKVEEYYITKFASGNGTNKSGFLALPSGFRNSEAEFVGIGEFGSWWSVSSNDSVASTFNLSRNSFFWEESNKSFGLSVRCVKFNNIKRYWQNGKLSEMILDTSGIFKHIRYYESGKVQQIQYYSNFLSGEKLGEWLYYKEDGNLHSRYVYDQNKQILQEKYHDNKRIKEVFRFKSDGIASSTEYYEDGSLKSEGDAKFISENHFEKIGDWKYYHINGKTNRYETYSTSVPNKKVGIWKSYDLEGNLLSTENMEFDNRFRSYVKEYNKNGNVFAEGAILEGQNKIGTWKTYHDDGKLQSVRNYSMNTEDRIENNISDSSKTFPDGVWKYYSQDGLLSKIEYHLNGTLVKAKLSDEVENLGSYKFLEVDAEFPGGKGEWQKYLNESLDKYSDNFGSEFGDLTFVFTINIDGSISNIKVLECKLKTDKKCLGPSSALAKAVVDIVKGSPKWKPASVDKIPVKGYMRQQVSWSNED
jgi:uncharacterized protein (TIGR02145 family)